MILMQDFPPSPILSSPQGVGRGMLVCDEWGGSLWVSSTKVIITVYYSLAHVCTLLALLLVKQRDAWLNFKLSKHVMSRPASMFCAHPLLYSFRLLR